MGFGKRRSLGGAHLYDGVTHEKSAEAIKDLLVRLMLPIKVAAMRAPIIVVVAATVILRSGHRHTTRQTLVHI
jgi:hypothetical protein